MIRNIPDENIILENQRQRILNIEKFRCRHSIPIKIDKEYFNLLDFVEIEYDKV